MTLKQHFEDILVPCNTSYHRLRLLANKKWGPSPSTLIQIYKQYVQPIFECGSLSTITTSDNIISKLPLLQNKFNRLALRLAKYICTKLLYDSTGLPYVDRLLSSATKSLDRIAQIPVVEESISSSRLSSAWDRFPTPLLVVHPVNLQFNASYWGDLPKCQSLSKTGSPAYTRTHLAQSSDLESIASTACLPSQQLLGKQMSQHHAPTISLKPELLSRRFRLFF